MVFVWYTTLPAFPCFNLAAYASANVKMSPADGTVLTLT